MNKTSRARRYAMPAGVAAAVVAVGLVGGSTVAAQQASKAPPTVHMQLKKSGPRFQGPATVHAGQNLRIINDSDPQQIGPHTFTIVKKSLLPTTRKEQNACFPNHVCGRVAKAHQIDPNTFAAKIQLVKAGKAGWDKPFGSKHKGDSWFAGNKGDKFKQRVTAKPGTTLYYMCIIHPEMQGKIKVLP